MRRFEKIKDFEKTDILMPKRQTVYSAGYDIAAFGDYLINPHEICLIKTGVKVKMNTDEVLKIYPRSSLARKKGLFLTNHVGVVDSDYYNNIENDGHIMISVYNFTNNLVKIDNKEKIAQGIFEKYLLTEDDDANEMREGGFGSTSK